MPGGIEEKEPPSNFFHSQISASEADGAPACRSPDPLAPHQDQSEDINKGFKRSHVESEEDMAK